VRRRQQILQSAIALFAQQGVDSASLRTVGEAIGVSHAALRHYFSSRDELLVEVYRPRLKGLVPQPEDVVATARRNVVDVDISDERSLGAAVRDAIALAEASA